MSEIFNSHITANKIEGIGKISDRLVYTGTISSENAEGVVKSAMLRGVLMPLIPTGSLFKIDGVGENNHMGLESQLLHMMVFATKATVVSQMIRDQEHMDIWRHTFRRLSISDEKDVAKKVDITPAMDLSEFFPIRIEGEEII